MKGMIVITDLLPILNRFPESLSLEITTHCPLECEYCKREKGSGENLSWDDFLKIKDSLDSIKTLKRITFCGIGESLLHPKFYEIIHELKDYKVSIITSGTLKINYDKLCKENNVDIAIFSIDATDKDTIKLICGKTYNFENLLQNLNELNAYNKNQKSTKDRVMSVLNCTINKYNLNLIPDIVNFAAENGFTSIHYSLPWMNEEFVRENLQHLRGEFKEALKKAKEYGIYMENPFNSYCCITFNTIMPYVNMEGKFVPCGYGLNQNYIIGNIFDKSLPSLWKESKYEEFRTGKLCEECYFNKYGRINEGF